MKSKKINLFFFALLLGTTYITSQTLETKVIKQVSVTYNGYTDTIDLAPILINIDGNVVVSGNQKMNATQYDVSTAAQISNGVIVWSQSFNTSSDKAWTTASTRDGSGNIYVVGTIRTNTVNGLDYLLIKYNKWGVQQWSATYNGPNSTTDVASAITLDGSGNIYITGASDGTLTALTDYATIKYNSSGIQQWVSRYNYANSIDIATSIEYNTVSNLVLVTGSSGSTYTDWDFATIRYDESTGAQVGSASRIANVLGNAQDKTFSMASDPLGNVYIAGTSYYGTSYDMQLVKLDTSLNTVWVKNFDGHGFDDAGVNLALDSNLNIYVTGSSYINSSQTEMVVLKYNNAGTLKWKFQERSTNGSPNAEGVRVKVKSNNEIFVGGNMGNNSGQDLALFCLDSLGHLKIKQLYNGPTGLKDKFLDMALADSNFIYVSARTYSAGVDNNITIKYQYRNISQPTATLSGGVKYVGNEVIVKFDKQSLRLDTINDKKFTFGILSDFVHDSTVTKLSSALSGGGGLVNAALLETRKIFDFTQADSLSLSRTGNYIKVPDFYTELLVTLPSTMSAVSSSTLIQTIKPDVYWSDINGILETASTPKPLVLKSTSSSVLAANDPYYTLQGSLHTVPGYTNVNINCDSAWAITTGEPNIKVGIFDTGVYDQHPDFSGVPFTSWDFYINQGVPVSSNWDSQDHGTAVAGIIGAVRNNNTGIAGIAGGDKSINKQGVTMYDMYCVNSSVTGIQTNIANAIAKGAMGTNSGGLGLDVMNLSIILQSSYINTVTIGAHVIVPQMNFANRNGVAMISSKGNINLGYNAYPADYSEETTMSVGSTGEDGHHSIQTVNSVLSSGTWGNIDFLAPGTDSLVKTLSPSGYYDFRHGTSFAAPHVAGAVALMMSYVNTVTPTWDNLVHEDCENILEKTCVDLISSTYSEITGYDTVSGWGRINVNQALDKIKKNFYKIRHIDETHFSTSNSRTSVLVHSGLMMAWPSYNAIPAGTYTTDVYELTTTLNYSLPPNEQVIGAWPLFKESYGTRDSSDIVTDRPYHCKIVSYNGTSAVLKTYYYHNLDYNIYMPYPQVQCKSAFSLYTYDPSGTIGVKEVESISKNFSLFPNPNNGQYEVSFNSKESETLTYKAFNIIGQQVKTGIYKAQYGDNTIKINMSDLTNGVYILNIFDTKGLVYRQKVIKQ